MPLTLIIDSSGNVLINTLRSVTAAPSGPARWLGLPDGDCFDPNPLNSSLVLLPQLNDRLNQRRLWRWDGSALVNLGPKPDSPNELQQVRRVARDTAVANYKTAQALGFSFQSRVFPSDALSLGRMALALAAAQQAIANSTAWSTTFTDVDGNEVGINKNEMVQLAAAYDSRDRALTQNLKSLRQSINAATTAAEVEAIDVTSGW